MPVTPRNADNSPAVHVSPQKLASAIGATTSQVSQFACLQTKPEPFSAPLELLHDNPDPDPSTLLYRNLRSIYNVYIAHRCTMCIHR